MKVLVTGGAGFIGSHVVEELLNNRFEVAIIDNLITGFLGNIPKGAKFYQLDLNDSELEYVFEQEKPDYVIHLAAQTSVTASMSDPYFDFNTNLTGTVKILLLMKKYNVKKFLFASSAAVYGEPSYLPIDENHSTNLKSYYSLSKYAAEKYIEFSGKYNGLNYSILRFSNVYGPGQNANGEAGVISIFIDRLLSEKDVSIYDGSQTRDFVYVKDVAVACRLAMEGEKKGIFNISSCTETKIMNLYYLITELTDKKKSPVIKSRRSGEIDKSILDNRKFCHEFDWCLQYSLSEGLSETIQYYSKSVTLTSL